MKPDFTLEQKQNLYDLAMWLDKHADDLVHERTSDPSDVFSMFTYSSGTHADTKQPRIGHCGSIGCAIGWATYAVEPREATIITHGLALGYKFEDWSDYAQRLFGVHDGDGEVGMFMFGSEWADWPDEDNPRATARRILAVLELDDAPQTWNHWTYEAGVTPNREND